MPESDLEAEIATAAYETQTVQSVTATGAAEKQPRATTFACRSTRATPNAKPAPTASVSGLPRGLVTVTDPEAESISDWFRCPECGAEDCWWSVNNGRLLLSCKECGHTNTKLVGRATFR